VFSDQPHFLVNRSPEDLRPFFLVLADLSVGVGAKRVLILVPSSHLASRYVDLFSDETFQELSEIVDDLSFGHLAELDAGGGRHKDAKDVLIGTRDDAGFGVEIFLAFCDEADQLCVLLPEWLVEGEEDLIGYAISHFLEKFTVV
jgi:hypothetical protein